MIFKPRVFVSYRRNDVPELVDRLVDHLEHHLGARNVFRDVSHIEAGDAFSRVIKERLEQADVLLLVMGGNWEAHRLADDGDWIRKETESAIRNGSHVVLVAMGDAELPGREALPATIQPILDEPVAEIRTDRRGFREDVEAFVQRVSQFPRRGRTVVSELVVPLGVTLGVTFLCCGLPGLLVDNPEVEDPAMKLFGSICVWITAAIPPLALWLGLRSLLRERRGTR